MKNMNLSDGFKNTFPASALVYTFLIDAKAAETDLKYE